MDVQKTKKDIKEHYASFGVMLKVIFLKLVM
jgi:hypothetical protein